MKPEELAEIAAYAKQFNQRLGQFLSNCYEGDLFYISDEELIRLARDYYNLYKSGLDK